MGLAVTLMQLECIEADTGDVCARASPRRNKKIPGNGDGGIKTGGFAGGQTSRWTCSSISSPKLSR